MKSSKVESTALARAVYVRPLQRTDVTEMIVAAKIKKKMKWETIAKKIGQSKEWTTSALLGQMQMTKKQAEIAGKLFDLPEEAIDLLQIVPMKASFPGGVPTDPLLYRLYEMVLIYGTTIKALIHEEFGDGIMSAIDFDMDLTRLPNEKGDRVKLVLTGKYLQYKTY